MSPSRKLTAGELEHARNVRAMFSRISPSYDFLNHFLSVNIDRRWRRRVRRLLAAELSDPEAIVLDVACGTGDLSIELKTGARARVIGTDFCRPMLSIAADKNDAGGIRVPYVEGDALALPFGPVFDAVTIAFGLRNLANWEDGLKELGSVLKPGGKLVILEFSAPVVPGFRSVFDLYFRRVLPRIGGVFSGEQGAYEYLSDSVRRFPNQKELAGMLSAAGFESVRYKNLTGGVAAIHVGEKSG